MTQPEVFAALRPPAALYQPSGLKGTGPKASARLVGTRLRFATSRQV